LEKLDEGAERVTGAGQDDGLNIPEDVQLQSILAARGLDQDEEETLEKETLTDNDSQMISVDEAATDAPPAMELEEMDAMGTEDQESTAALNPPLVDESPPESRDSEAKPQVAPDAEAEKEIEDGSRPTDTTTDKGNSTEIVPAATSHPKDVSTPQRDPPRSQGGEPSSAPGPLSPTSHAMLRESQKESRTLRRHVVALNKQLEHAETELQAQRVELERAAERMEKDRARHREDRESEKTRHSEEIKTIKTQNDKTLKELKQRSDSQIDDVRKQLRDLEDRRMQEGGDWNKELIDAVQREQEMARRLALMEDEKGTLLSQISILQDQQLALGNRIESLTQTADSAMERERESETRLDEALNLHARQIAQRQARESELERTVAELGSALVTARSKASKTVSRKSDPAVAGTMDNSDATSENPTARLQAVEQEMEGVIAQLQFEKQRCETLQNELRDVSKERTDEAASNHAKQIKTDRQVAELSHTITRLESELRIAKNNGSMGGSTASSDQEGAKQIRELSEELLTQREKIANCHSEISTLKSRLKVANERTRTAEIALEEADSRNGMKDVGWRDVERAPISGDSGMRRRGGGTHSRRSAKNDGESMRAALHLDAVRSRSSEQIGKALDGVDAFLVSSGKFLRFNALARLLFISYLLTLHIWTFVLIILYTHGFESVHGDFGAGHGIAHRPAALMQAHDPAAVVAAASRDGQAAEGNT